MKQAVMKIALSGSGGRMGAALQALIQKRPEAAVADKANRSRPASAWDPLEIDGVIDFSLPPLFRETARWCEKHKKALVSGTTGLSAADKVFLEKASQKIPLFYGENMSWGIWQAGRWISSVMTRGGAPEGGLFADGGLGGGGAAATKTSSGAAAEGPGAKSDAETAPLKTAPIRAVVLKDIHHKGKKDSPSGTALRLKSRFPPALRELVEIQSFREGETFGTHRIEIQAAGERLILEHQALSREVFAFGALNALFWLVKKPPGLYNPDDLFGLI